MGHVERFCVRASVVTTCQLMASLNALYTPESEYYQKNNGLCKLIANSYHYNDDYIYSYFPVYMKQLCAFMITHFFSFQAWLLRVELFLMFVYWYHTKVRYVYNAKTNSLLIQLCIQHIIGTLWCL